MAIIVLEKRVVNVMISRRSEAETMEELIPRKGVFRMNQRQPVSIEAAESHVRPHIAMNEVRGCVERYQNHENGVQHRSIEGIE